MSTHLNSTFVNHANTSSINRFILRGEGAWRVLDPIRFTLECPLKILVITVTIYIYQTFFDSYEETVKVFRGYIHGFTDDIAYLFLGCT
jgi:hypothetical protein